MLAHTPAPLPRYILPGLFLAVVAMLVLLGGLRVYWRTSRLATCVQVTEEEGARQADAVRICVDGGR